jgi:hypothetical protein
VPRLHRTRAIPTAAFAILMPVLLTVPQSQTRFGHPTTYDFRDATEGLSDIKGARSATCRSVTKTFGIVHILVAPPIDGWMPTRFLQRFRAGA